MSELLREQISDPVFVGVQFERDDTGEGIRNESVKMIAAAGGTLQS